MNDFVTGGWGAAEGHLARAGESGSGDFYLGSHRAFCRTEADDVGHDRKSFAAGRGSTEGCDDDLLTRLGIGRHGSGDLRIRDDFEAGSLSADDHVAGLSEADSGERHRTAHYAAAGSETRELRSHAEYLAALVTRRKGSDGHRAGECAGGNDRGQVRIGDVVVLRRDPVKGNASCSLETLAEDIDGIADLAVVGQKFHERLKAHGHIKDCAVVVGSAGVGGSVK